MGKTKTGYNVTGKSVNDLLNMESREFSQVAQDRQALSRVVSRLASAANKRIKRMQAQGENSPALIRAMESGGKFSVKGKSTEELKREYMRVKNFLQDKTSDLKQWKKLKKKLQDSLAKSGITLDEGKVGKVIHIYEEVRKKNPEVSAREYKYKIFDTIQTLSDNISINQQIDYIEDNLENIYLETKKEKDSIKDVSSLL